MNRTLKFAVSLLLCGALLLPTLTGCSDDNVTAGTGTGTGTSGVTTPAATTKTQDPPADPTNLLSQNVYAAAGIESAENLVKRYYVKRTHTVKRSFSESRDAEVWYVAAFLDALSEAVRLYPDNATVKEAYVDCLDNCLAGYRVTNATISPPSGQVYQRITYYNAGKGTAGDFYFDDNAWICIAYLTAYELLGTEEYLTRAEEILEFLWTGYDDYQGGGIYWSKTWQFDDKGKPSNKGTCTNAPSAISYLLAYKYTQKAEYLERAKLLYSWLTTYIECNNGVYHAGVNDPWQPAYDQGTMMMLTVMLYEIEGDDAYLKKARTSYNGTIGHIFKVSGRNENMKVVMNGNPLYKSWCIGWLVRGMCRYYSVDSRHNTIFMKYMEMILNQTLETKDRYGHYDPCFCVPNCEWAGPGPGFNNEVISPAGVTSVLLLAAYFDVYQRGSNEAL